MKFSVLFLIAVLCCPFMQAQPEEHVAYIGFAVNKSVYDAGFGDNSREMSSLIDVLRAAQDDEELTVTSIKLYGTSSPEGSRELNSRLARERIASVERQIGAGVTINDTLVSRDNRCIMWSLLRDGVAASDMKYRDEVLAIIDQGEMFTSYHKDNQTIDKRVVELQRLHGGEPWAVLLRRYFPGMRKVCVVVTTERTPKREPAPPEELPVVEVMPAPKPVIENPVMVPEPAVVVEPEPDEWLRQCYLKSNGVGWLMLISNIAFEYEFSPRWSLSVPIYYSAVNYFTYKVKFRTAAIQPELRYWLRSNDGSTVLERAKANTYVGVHLGIAHYNYALGGDYRRQDHDGKTPAYGGGISFGTRIPLGHTGRWYMEFTGGVGYYHLYYDKFVNEPNGCELSSTKKNFFCIDNVAVTVVYRLDTKKKAE